MESGLVPASCASVSAAPTNSTSNLPLPSPSTAILQLLKRRKSPDMILSAHNDNIDTPSSSSARTLKRPKNLPIAKSLNHSIDNKTRQSVSGCSGKNNQSKPSTTTRTATLNAPSLPLTPMLPLLPHTFPPLPLPSPSRSLPPYQPLSQIFDYLYLGSLHDACSRHTYQNFGVTDVINLTTNHTLPFHHVTSFMRIAIDDNQHDSLLPHLPSAFALIEEAKQRGGVVLVHCLAGVSRSASLVIAYLICHHEMTFASAYQFVKSKRPIIAPNFNFLGQLLTLEQQQLQQHQQKPDNHKQHKQQHPQPQQQPQQQQQKNGQHQHKRLHHTQANDQLPTLTTNQETENQDSCKDPSPKPQYPQLNLFQSPATSLPPHQPLHEHSPPFPYPQRPQALPYHCILPHNSSLDHPSPLESFEIQVS